MNTQATTKTQVALGPQLTSPNTGNSYFNVKALLKRASGITEVRDLSVIFNPRWKTAQDIAIEEKKANKQPSLTIVVKDMERSEENPYEGTGSVWMRRKGLHTGTFNFDGVNYSASITRDEQGELQLTLEELIPVEPADL